MKKSRVSEKFSQISQAVQQVWQQAFGIKVTLFPSDGPVHLTAVRQGDYQIATMKFNFNVDPVYTLQSFKYKCNMMNLTNWESQEYIDLLEASNYEVDFEKRKRILIAAEKVLMDEMPIIPIHFKTMEFSKNPRLTGALVSKGDIDFKFARFSY
ncbi:MAG: hypothetical protein QNJ27_02165 [Simkaniaceae bacterium]|nr:hypothetical protein [Simkaniaceae bacterium]